MSENEQEQPTDESTDQPTGTDQAHEPGEIADDQLPEDLRPSEDNPLARHPGETGDEADVIGGDRDGEPERAPLTEEDADYGSGGSPA